MFLYQVLRPLIASFLLVLLSPLIFFLIIAIKFSSKGTAIFKQIRLGRNKKTFTMYKIRTMVEDAENIKNRYLHLNEASYPVFKIKNDPRYTKMGELISRFGLDEIPQLLNIIKGEMTFVGPRPLPVEEAKRIPKKYEKRFSVLPGITSLWVIKGGHKLKFNEWMELDLNYIEKKSFRNDLYIFMKTIFLLIGFRKNRPESRK